MDVKSFIQRLGDKKTLAENEVKNILKEYGIPTTRYAVVESEDEIEHLELSYPLAVKVCSSEILHKTDVGGVVLNVPDEEMLIKTFREMRERFPKEKILIESMEEKGVELIIGLIDDATFGLSIMFGLGGIFTELFNDVTFRVIPIERIDAEEMLTELKGRKLLEGFRGIKVNRGEIVNLIMKTAQLGEDFDGYIQSMDLNPIFAREKDVVVVDAKLLFK